MSDSASPDALSFAAKIPSPTIKTSADPYLGRNSLQEWHSQPGFRLHQQTPPSPPTAHSLNNPSRQIGGGWDASTANDLARREGRSSLSMTIWIEPSDSSLRKSACSE